MAASRTRTIKNKHAVPKQKPENDKKGSSSARVSKPRRPSAAPPSKQVHKSSVSEAKKPKKKTWTSEELGVPKLNMVTPLGVTKPPGKKKGKVFVDDRESMNTILSIVQAEKHGQIESKMIKARQMEEIREARKAEAEKKEQERRAKVDDAKESLKKKRKRKSASDDADPESIRSVSSTGTRATKPKKRVSFA